MRTIVHVIHSLEIAGAENVCITICSNLNKQKYQVYIVTIYDANPLAEKLKNYSNVEVISLGVRLNTILWVFSPKVFLKFRRILKKISPNVLHSHLWGIGTWFLFGVKGLGIRNTIATIHTSGGHYKSRHWFSFISRNVEKWTYKLLKFKLVCVSEEVQKNVQENLRIFNSTVIFNGVDIDYFQPRNGSSRESLNYPVLIHVGRYFQAKNHWDIIRSLPKLKSKFPNFRMDFLGSGVQEHLEQFCEENQMKDNVRFLGVKKNVLNYLSQADIGLLPSSYEGLSLALLEMMSCELPVIVSDITSFKEITEKGTCSKTVALHQIEELSNCIIDLASNKIQMENMGKTGRKIVAEYFSHNRMVSAY